jgi:outer membrane protein assembly factor BamB
MKTPLLLTALATLAVASAEPLPALAGHDFFYAGEGKTQDLYVVKKGEIVWSHHNPGSRGEISDAVLLSSGNVLYAHQFGVTLIDPAGKILWNYDAPEGCETHTARPIGTERVVFLQNGPEPKAVIVNVVTGTTEREFALSVGNLKSTHGQFRHAEITAAGTLLVAHLDQGKVSEYDDHGKELWTTAFPGPWSASRLASGKTLIASTGLIREVDPAGKTVWEVKPADFPGHVIKSFQLATRLPNGNTVLNNWVNSWNEALDPETMPEQAFEITPDKKIVWTLKAWKDPANLGPATTIQLLDTPSAPEKVHFGEFH